MALPSDTYAIAWVRPQPQKNESMKKGCGGEMATKHAKGEGRWENKQTFVQDERREESP